MRSVVSGVVLRLEQSAEEPPDLRSREAPVSDDEVEVVEEWTLPTGPKETVTEMLDCSPPLYVPVIQRPADQSPGAPLTVSVLQVAFSTKYARNTTAMGLIPRECVN